MPTSRSRSLSLLLSAFICVHLRLAPGFAAPAAGFPTERRETHYGIFFGGGRIGTSSLVEAPAKFRGKTMLKVDSTTKIRISALGAVEQNVDLVQYIDQSWSPVHLIFSMGSGGHATRVTADFFPDRIECELNSQGSKSKKTIPVPKGVSLVADPNLLGDRGLKPGEKRQLHLFEPLTLQVLPMDVEVLRAEKFDLSGKSYMATVIKAVTSITGESTSWITEDGQLLQSDSALGIRMVREDGPPKDAPSAAGDPQAYTPPIDLAVATAIKTETNIPDPRATRYLRVRIAGVPERRLILTDARQRATVVTDATTANEKGLTVIYEVDSSVGTPSRTKSASPSARYLGEAPYLEVKDPRIQRQAKAIVGKETDARRKASKIRAWIHGRMKADPSIGIPRAATDVLAAPKGVCRDYAILFAALARAAGIPTRICSGTIYFKGSFYYHAWNEILLDPARDRWLPFDATLPTDFVDATHIKFAQGDATEMFHAVRVVGQLKAEILEFR